MSKTTRPLVKVTLRLHADTYEYYHQMAAGTSHDVSANQIIRTILDDYALKLKAEERTRIDQIQPKRAAE